jgi:hypothetical protein
VATGTRVVMAVAVLVLLALVAPSAATAQGPLPLKATDGVRIVRERGQIVVVFAKRAERLWRRVAGRRVDVHCTQLFENGTGSGNNVVRAPKRGRRIPTGDGSRGWDYCRLWLEARTVRREGGRRRVPRRLIASLPLTQQGTVFLDNQYNAYLLMTLLMASELAAEERGREGFLTPNELMELASTEPSAPGLVVLLSPSDTPPTGTVGYYSDGAKHAAAVTVSAAGKRLFVEVNGDAVHTNVLSYLGPLD